mmetsp:Transcript_130875/g.244940  ORF Transcript_130875/g.244940 Transcript_130875/m.244940 type:complete len:202 (-) Transcript_130875:306-911(-)
MGLLHFPVLIEMKAIGIWVSRLEVSFGRLMFRIFNFGLQTKRDSKIFRKEVLPEVHPACLKSSKLCNKVMNFTIPVCVRRLWNVWLGVGEYPLSRLFQGLPLAKPAHVGVLKEFFNSNVFCKSFGHCEARCVAQTMRKCNVETMVLWIFCPPFQVFVDWVIKRRDSTISHKPCKHHGRWPLAGAPGGDLRVHGKVASLISK